MMLDKITQLFQSAERVNIQLALELIAGQGWRLKELAIIQEYANLLGWLHYDIHDLGEKYTLFLYEPDELTHEEITMILVDLLETDYISLQIDVNPPSALWHLPKLRFLELKSPNETFDTIPPTIKQLTSLESLSIGAPNITVIPSELCQLPKLAVLNISGTAITVLPSNFHELPTLTQLDLGHNAALTAIPDQLPPQLQYLYLNDCTAITQLPDSICTLPLERLNLWNTSITTLPTCFHQLQALRYLGLQDTPLRQLPPNMTSLQELRWFFTDGSQIHQQAKTIKQQLPNLTRYD